MRNTFLFLAFFTTLCSFSQNQAIGFYQVDETSDGKWVKGLDGTSGFYVVHQPILVLDDVKNVQTQPAVYGGAYDIAFELTDSGTEKFKSFTQQQAPTQMALLFGDKLITTPNISMPITNGMFFVSGFDYKKARAVRNALLRQMGKKPLYSKDDFDIYKSRATYKTLELYNTEKDHEVFMDRELAPDSDCRVFFESYYNPLSLIGTYYSYEYGEASESACGPMGSGLGVVTVNIETGRQASLLTFFNENDLVKAFKNDGWIKQREKNGRIQLEKIQDLDDIIDSFKSDVADVVFTPYSFCIIGIEDGVAKVRFVGRQAMGWNHHRHLQLGFELPVKKEALRFFTEPNNFFLGNFKSGLEK